MVKSKGSMTSTLDRIRSGELIHTMAGNYPSSMDKLVDANGHISLVASDYTGYDQSDVETFLASRGYEARATFDPDGNVIMLASQWKNNTVSHDPNREAFLIRRAGSYTGEGFTDFHSHPYTLDGGQVQVFSPQDVKAYLVKVEYGSKGTRYNKAALPTKFRVTAGDGTYFELEYVGGGKRDVKNFKSAYTKAFNREDKRTNSPLLSRRAAADEMTAGMSEWLSSNAGLYGFRYNTNCNYKVHAI